MATVSTWAELNADLLGVVLAHIPCLANRVDFPTVCSGWRSAAQQYPPPPQLPWLLLPYNNASSSFCVLCKEYHRLFLHGDANGARFCGSFPGGWFVLAFQQLRDYALLNLHNGQSVAMPDNLSTPDDGVEHSVFIRAAALSAAPDEEDERYVAAALVWSACTIAFWRPGMTHWSPPTPVEVHERQSWRSLAPGTFEILEDVIYYSDHGITGFHVLTMNEEILVYVPENGPDGALTTRLVTYRFPDHHVTPPDQENVVSRYLVESRGELLMVVRLTSPEEVTVSFRVFALAVAQDQDQDQDGNRQASWNEVQYGSGRMLFVARASSRAFESSQFYGIDLPDYIYFLDDETTFVDEVIALEDEPEYPCSDTGRCGSFYRVVEPIVPQGPIPPSDCSRPVWFFP